MVYLFCFAALVACCVAVSFWLEVREARALREIVKHGTRHRAAAPLPLVITDDDAGDTTPSVLDMHDSEGRVTMATPRSRR